MPLAPDVISPEPVDGFKKFERCLEAEKILHNLYRIDFKISVLQFNKTDGIT